MKSTFRRKAAARWVGGIAALLLVADIASAATDVTARFEAANLLYERGQFEPAAGAYEVLLEEGVRSSAMLFNAGNAWFKAGKTGRAVAYWLQAEAIDPRNERIQINLEFARKAVNGGAPPAARWTEWLRKFTLDEWALVFLASGWLFFGSLALLTWRPALRRLLRGPEWLGGVMMIASLTVLVITTRDRANTVVAVVVADEAVVRFGPLAASQSAFVARDGTEFLVIDRKDEWLRVADAQGRDGWLLGNQVIQIRAGQMVSPPASTDQPVPLQARGNGQPEVHH